MLVALGYFLIICSPVSLRTTRRAATTGNSASTPSIAIDVHNQDTVRAYQMYSTLCRIRRENFPGERNRCKSNDSIFEVAIRTADSESG